MVIQDRPAVSCDDRAPATPSPASAFRRAGRLARGPDDCSDKRDRRCRREGTNSVLGERSWSGLLPNPPRRNVHIRIPGPCDCDLICRKGLCRCGHVKALAMRPSCVTPRAPNPVTGVVAGDGVGRECQPPSGGEGAGSRAQWPVVLISGRGLGRTLGARGPRPSLGL